MYIGPPTGIIRSRGEFRDWTTVSIHRHGTTACTVIRSGDQQLIGIGNTDIKGVRCSASDISPGARTGRYLPLKSILIEIRNTTSVEIEFNQLTRTKTRAAVCLNPIGGLDTILALDITGLADSIPAKEQKNNQKQGELFRYSHVCGETVVMAGSHIRVKSNEQ